MNIIAMSAHPDDMELEAGGTLARYSKKGHTIYHIILTTDFSNIRKSEALEASKILGIKEVIFLNNKDTELECTGKLIAEIDSLVEQLKPDLIISHHPFDSHQDHKTAAELLFSVARKGNIKNVLSGSPLPYRPNVFTFRPQFFVDVTETIDIKAEAIRAHKSQYSRYGSEKLIERIFSMARYYGWSMGYEYAECYEVVRMCSDLCL
jgi:LmbE family N-acetylglucosaminyl deacetylase